MLTRAIVLPCLAVLAAAVAAANPGIAIDNSYFDWQDVPAVARFAEQLQSLLLQPRDAGQARDAHGRPLPVLEPRRNPDPRDQGDASKAASLYIYVGTETNLAPEVSIFGYVYVGRKPGEVNRYTLELLPARRKGGGFVAIWSRDGKAVEAGELVNSSFSVECRIDISKVPADIVSAWDDVSIDVTTCYREAASGTYEEFYFTTLYPADMMAAP